MQNMNDGGWVQAAQGRRAARLSDAVMEWIRLKDQGRFPRSLHDIHETIPITLGGWTLTHTPTGYAVLSTRLRLPLVATRAELLASGLDWSFTDPKALTDEHKRVGKALRKKYEGQQ